MATALVIQNKENRLFVMDKGIWVGDCERALRFETAEGACDYCKANDLTEHRVVILIAGGVLV